MNRNDIIFKKFPHTVLGYDVAAVDSFLDDVIRELDRLNARIALLEGELRDRNSEKEEPEVGNNDGTD